MDNYFVSLKLIVNNIDQITIVFRDIDGDSRDEFLARRNENVRIAPPSQKNEGSSQGSQVAP
jgi:hypothetical protein